MRATNTARAALTGDKGRYTQADSVGRNGNERVMIAEALERLRHDHGRYPRPLLAIALALLLSACLSVKRREGYLADETYNQAFRLISSGNLYVNPDDLAGLFHTGQNCRDHSASLSVHSDAIGCICCITFDLLPDSHPSCRYEIRSVYVYYSATDREAVAKYLDRLIDVWKPQGGKEEDESFPSAERDNRREVRVFRANSRTYEARIDIYRHHSMWTGSLVLSSYPM